MIGDIVKVKGIDLLILDKINGNPFVIALNLNIDTKFSNGSNNYTTSILRQKVDKWIENSGIDTIEREVDLTTMDGYTIYGKRKFYAAPLTFDEYRKYANIIIPHVKRSFWLCTGWGRPGKDLASHSACSVFNDGKPSSSYYGYNNGLAPAFILDKSWTNKDLSNFSNEELMDEIASRIAKNNRGMGI